MTELSQEPPRRAIAAPRRRSSTGADRCYVRFAVLGDRAGALAPWRDGWPLLLADLVAARHDISWCDASAARATAYDVRRVQLRVAVAHRPHLVVLDVGHGWSARRHRDVEDFRTHLTHCVRVLSARGAVLVTARSHRGPLGHARRQQLDTVYEGLARDFGTIHLDLATGAAGVMDQFAEAASARGLELGRVRDLR
nr:hypothetical protein GCM10020063_001200 [Dactylosporangium thailandense]